ncbi:hypothetical protein [Hyphomicrobium sp. CS1BSMeth3]|uniref:hypothetical protein n=1 Tax=Hyphomicrobium sp. CS1BSMeth3 TaxID=1892844 RepID=UPI00093076CC|nr:hypothetical protein [Hyphomicrobium sp. CS1BSMeth3]
MTTIAEYKAWQAEQQNQAVAAANFVLGSAGPDEKPDQVALDLKIASEYSKAVGGPVPPVPLVKEFRSTFEREIAERRNAKILAGSPRLTEWLRNPDNARVASDDLDNLSWFEGFGRGVGATLQRSGQRFQQMGAQAAFEQAAGRAADRTKTFGQLVDAQKIDMRDMHGNRVDTMAGPVEWFGAFARWIDARYAEAIGTDDTAAAQHYAAKIKVATDAMAATPKSSIAQAFETEAQLEGGTLGETLASWGAAFVRNPIGGLSWMFETAGESAPIMAAALGTSIVTRDPLKGAAVMGGGSYLQERYTSPAEFLKEKKIDLGKPEDVAKLLTDPELMREAAERGVIRGAVIGAFDMLSIGIAGRSLAGHPIVEGLAHTATQAFMGGGGEYAARLAAGQEIDWNEIVAEGFAEMATTPIDMGVAGRSVIRDRRKAEKAEETKDTIAELSGAAQVSKLRERLPDAFRQFLDRALENGPVENVYIPAGEFVSYFQTAGVDPFELLDSLEGVTREDLDDALVSGGDIKIPTATYAGKLAGTEHDAFLLENMRFDPNEFTSKEAAEFNARAQEAMDEAFRVAEEARKEDERFRSFEAEIYDTMVSRLRAAGRSTEVATTEAMLYPAFYRTMAERSGMGIDEFIQRYQLPRVEGALPAGMQFKDVDELNRQLAEARSRRTVRDSRQTLLEFIHQYGGIDDIGGELRARNADTIKQGRGRKTLRLARTGVAAVVRDMFGAMTGGKRHGADDVALAAIEAGFMGDDRIVSEYQAAQREGREVPDISAALWEAIDKELRGEPQYSSLDASPQPQSEIDGLDAIEEYLAGLGVSLDDDDATIRAAIGDGKQYEQAGRRGSIQFPAGGVANGAAVIRVFEQANLSTVLHETGHFYLEVLADLAARGETQAQADMATLREWWRENADAVAKDATKASSAEITATDVRSFLDAGTTGDAARDAAVDTGIKEQATRGFEAYLMEGRAPTSALQAAFDKFRSWLITVYKRIKGVPGVKISNDIRRVFDRMLASDQEIARAQEDVGGTALLFSSPEQMGLTSDEYAAFMKMKAEAESDAQARLLRDIMGPARREKQEQFKAERATIREEVEREINAQPVFRAIEWMGNKRWFGESQPADITDFRLSKDILVARYGTGIVKTLPRGKVPVYAVKGGLDPDDAAEWFGFKSGDELVRALEQAPKRTDAIEAETDRVMNERHGDPLQDGEIQAKALDAIHTEKRGDWIAAELKAVVEIAGAGVGLTVREARAAARQSIQRMRVRDAINTQRFLAAERKAGEEAARLGRMLARDKVWLDAAQRRIQSRLSAKEPATLRSIEALNKAIERRNAMLESQTVEFDMPDRTVTTGDGQQRTVRGGRRRQHIAGYNENVAKLIDAKRRQLVNHALYMEARGAAEELERAERFVQSLGKKEKRERIGGAGRRESAQVDYLAAIDEILVQYNFKRMTAAAEQRRGALLDFVERMKAVGRENELNIDDAVLASAARRPYKTLTLEELQGVVDSLKNLEHMALRWNTLLDTQNERVFEDAVSEVTDAFDANVKKRPPGRVKTRAEALRHSGRQFLDLVLNAGTLLREVDGFKDLGPAYRNLKTPIDEAMNRLIVRKEKAAKDLEQLYSVYSADERRQMSVRQHIPDFGYALSKWEMISVALNTGNAGNLQRLTDPKVGRSLTEAQVARVLNMLDGRDAKFVQSVWDYVGSFWSDIVARERRTTGVAPRRVEPSPITIAGIELRGGYYPIKYDARLSALARDDETQMLAESLQAGRFGKAQTRHGHLKERSRASGRDIDLDMGVLHQHVGQVVHDLEMSEPVTNAWRILQDGRVRGQFTEAGRQADFEALETWLKDVAEGELRAGDIRQRMARVAKTNFTAAKLAFNFGTVAIQVTGLAQSMVVLGKQDFARGVQAAFRPGVIDEIVAKSPFMRSRQTTFNKDIYDLYNDPLAGPVASRWAKIRSDLIGKYGFWLMTKVQWHVVDVPTWLAGYHQGLRQFKNIEAKAVAHADAVVKRSQASGLFSDRSAVERGSASRTSRQSDVTRLFTTLASYMFAKFNVAYERTAKAKRTIAQEGVSTRSAQEVMSWTLDMALLFTLEALLVAAIRGRLPDEDEDESWLWFLAKETGLSFMATIPVVRDVAGPLQGFQGGGAYGSITKEAADLPLQIGQGEVDWGLLRATINATGLATGLPAVQINRLMGAHKRQSEGEDVMPIEYLMGRMGK